MSYVALFVSSVTLRQCAKQINIALKMLTSGKVAKCSDFLA